MDLTKLVVLLLTVVSSIAERNAPVLVWESTSTGTSLSGLASIPATSNAQLKNLLDSMDSEALVMFIMNELNVEDFSGRPDELRQLKNEFESSQHMYAPSMQDPAQVPAMLSSYSRVTVDLSNLGALKLAPGAQKTLFVVYINDKPGADRNKALQHSDNTISSVLSQVRTLTKKYSAVLTGKHTSMDGEESHRVARSLKAAAVDPPLAYFFNFSCIYLYTSAAPVMRFSTSAGNTVQLNLTSALVTANSSSCPGNGNQSASITWSNVQGPAGYSLDTVELKYSFTYRKSGRATTPDSVSSWTVPNVTIAYSGTVAGKAVAGVQQTLDMDDVYAPALFSYHCTSRKWAVENSTDNMMTSLELPGFQVQAFLSDKATSFGRAWDCTTFFTIPIWSGLFLSLILLLIFIWSMYMLASVPTSDRFDDPRGQPLHVPVSE